MSTIEQAAKRLEELRRAGIDVTPAGNLPAQRPTTRGAVVGLATVAPPGTTHSPLVELNLKQLEAAGYVVPDAPRSRLADEFRTIKRPLLANMRGESAAPVARANCIMITSALPGEGKTYTAINLALSIASELDTRVLLIDADVIRPMVLERLGLRPGRGLLDKLKDPALDVGELMLRTNVEKLSLLPAGQPAAHANELLASDAMRDVVNELALRYSDRVVLFDAPPLLAAPETRVLATHVGQIVVVVEAQHTPRSAVRSAMALVERCPVVLTMLNKTTGLPQLGYGYGYGGRG